MTLTQKSVPWVSLVASVFSWLHLTFASLLNAYPNYLLIISAIIDNVLTIWINWIQPPLIWLIFYIEERAIWRAYIFIWSWPFPYIYCDNVTSSGENINYFAMACYDEGYILEHLLLAVRILQVVNSKKSSVRL